MTLPPLKQSRVVHRALGLVLGALACTQADDPAPAPNPAPEAPAAMDNCENSLSSVTPCPGLLPRCPAVQPSDARYLELIAMTDCVGEHVRELGTIDYVQPEGSPGFQLRLVSGCSVLVDVANRAESAPSWPWRTLGQELDVELWWAEGIRAGGSAVWLILRSSEEDGPIQGDTENDDFLLAHSQSSWRPFEGGIVEDALGFDAAIAEPTCELMSSHVLDHLYAIRFQTELASVVLAARHVSTLELPDGHRLRVQSGGAWITHDHLVPLGYPIYDVNWGPHARFSAWPEP